MKRRSGCVRCDPATTQQSGVALIIVLGLIALMMVLGVTFIVFTRTDRVAAANYSKDVVVRQLVHVALNRAMRDVESTMDKTVYPKWDVLVSDGFVALQTNSDGTVTPEAINKVDLSALTNAPVRDWIPQSVWPWPNNPVVATNLGPISLTNGCFVGWMDIEAQAGFPARIGYAVFNCSGLLDVNHAGVSNRAFGTDVTEIQVAELPDVKDADLLASNRFYETMQHLRVAGASGLNGYPSSLVAYSASRPWAWYGGTEQVTNLVDIGGDKDALIANGPAIRAALQECLGRVAPINDEDVSFVFTNLLDYVDSGHVPADLASPCTKAVPMINEVQVYGRLRIVGNEREPSVIVRVEWFYPFVKTSSVNFKLGYDVTLINANTNFFPVTNFTGEISDIGFTNTTLCTYPDPNPAHYAVNTNLVGKRLAYTNAQQIIAASGGIIDMTARVKLVIRDSGGAPCDAVPSPWTANEKALTVANILSPSSSLEGSVMNGAECIDPRFNWDGSTMWRTYQWIASRTGNSAASNGTLKGMNNIAVWYRTNNVDRVDEYIAMHVGGGPLKTVGELSYLVRGKGLGNLWRTIQLYPVTTNVVGDVDRVFDYFRIGEAAAIEKGKVNPNTTHVPVLHALLRGLTVDKYPGEREVDADDYAKADSLAGWWADNLSGGSFTNVSDIYRLSAAWDNSWCSSLSPFEKEAMIRNTAGLLAPRQNYFIILLVVETTKYVPQMGTSSLGRIRALAEVWRDPVPGLDGHHSTLIRMVRILNDE